jgi:exodeoxyribonuclease V alpha subunit
LLGADQAARTIAAGPGRLGMHRGRVRDAKQHLDAWAATWSPMVVDGDLDLRQLARRPVAYPSTVPQVAFALHQHAQRLAAAEHPDQATRLGAARQARARYDAVAASYHEARRQLEQLSHQPVYDTGAAELIPDLTDRLAAAGHRVAAADQRVQRLSADPAIIGQPDPDALLETARATWNVEQIVDHQQRAFRPSDTARSIRHEPHPTPQIDHGPSIGR